MSILRLRWAALALLVVCLFALASFNPAVAQSSEPTPRGSHEVAVQQDAVLGRIMNVGAICSLYRIEFEGHPLGRRWTSRHTARESINLPLI